MEKGEPSCTVGGNADWRSHYENKMEFPQKKKKKDLPYNLVIPLLDTHPKKPKTLIQKNICTPVFIAVLFSVAKIGKQPKNTSINEWIKT